MPICGLPQYQHRAYGFPVTRAAQIAIETIKEQVPKHRLEEVRMVLFSQVDYDTYKQAAEL